MRRWQSLAVVLLPAVAGIGLGLALDADMLPSSLFVLRVQVATGTLTAAVGLSLTVIAFVALWLNGRWHAALDRAAVKDRLEHDEAHRRFVRRLNHELKNPLTAIRAGLANLAEDDADGAQGSSLSNVHRQVDRLSRLTNDLRKLADLETCEVESAPVDLVDIVNEAVEMVTSAPGRAGRTVNVNAQNVPWPLSPVRGDRDLLLLAVYNLLDNALKFSDPRATVEVRASEDGSRATLEVIDTGQGIAEEDLPHVSEELYRGKEAQGIEGSGLGLALVGRVARLHGGELAVRSRQGKGTIAGLRLPLA
jgi:two-component system, OmpR family, sensor kinase